MILIAEIQHACDDCGVLIKPSEAASVRNGALRCRPCQKHLIARATELATRPAIDPR